MDSNYSLIVGATSGLGRSLSIALAKKNIDLILIGKSEFKLKELQLHLNSFSNSRILTLSVDLADACRVESSILNANFRNVKIDTLIYCAVKKYVGDSMQIDVEKLQEMMSVNYYSVIAIIKAFSNKFIPDSNVYLVTSGVANFGVNNDGAYSATKAALERYAEAARIELKNKNINVSLISPGPMKTDLALFEKSFSGDIKPLMNTNAADPNEVALKIISCIGRKKRRINLTLSTSIIRFLALFAPIVLEFLTTKKKND
jgi:short-subunit dehydrogenase